MNHPNQDGPTTRSRAGADRRALLRRSLLATGGTLGVVGLAEAATGPALATPGTTAWKLGGNSGVATNGSNFLGPTNSAPLIFKTKSAQNPLKERMRIQPNGTVGIGTTDPAARLDVKSVGSTPALRANDASGNSSTSGVLGVSTNGYGVEATSGYIGCYAHSDAGYGLYGYSADSIAAYLNGENYGVYATAAGTGVYGSGSSTGVRGSGSTYGGNFSGSTGIYASGTNGVSGHGGAIGVFGGDASNAGVRGDSVYVGVWGTGDKWGTYSEAKPTTGQVYGVYGATNSPSGFGLWSDGNAHVAGTLSKSAGSFKIDHPLDPANQWLSHSFVESPDMMNVYNGNVTLDAAGRATVSLPTYFSALNRDFRYQLTAVGVAGPDLHVARKITKNSFAIAGGTAGMEVSWQVTGIRKDPYAAEHPIVVEAPKTGIEKGALGFVPKGSKARRIDRRPTAVAVPAKHDAPAPEPGLRLPH